jgi:cytosine/adenosine deaminase-related metal-dependent hydrolase
VSSTPSTELQMGFGHPVALNPSLNLDSNCSLGIDCHSNSSASIVSEMRLLLQHSRGTYNQPFVDAGKQPRKMNKMAEEAFNLGTINGARAIGMQDKIGTLAVGKYADILVFDALSTSMVAAAQHDPVAAIVLHSSPADIEMVIVDGVVRKRSWMLEPVDLKAGKAFWDVSGEKDVLQWKEIARELVGRRGKLQKTAEGLDYKEAEGALIKGWHIDESLIVEKV